MRCVPCGGVQPNVHRIVPPSRRTWPVVDVTLGGATKAPHNATARGGAPPQGPPRAAAEEEQPAPATGAHRRRHRGKPSVLQASFPYLSFFSACASPFSSPSAGGTTTTAAEQQWLNVPPWHVQASTGRHSHGYGVVLALEPVQGNRGAWSRRCAVALRPPLPGGRGDATGVLSWRRAGLFWVRARRRSETSMAVRRSVPEGTAQSGRYCGARGEILRPSPDRRRRRRSAGASSSIKDESPGNKDDQTPS